MRVMFGKHEEDGTHMTEKLRVGIVGCGYWGEKHVRVMNQLPRASEVYAIDERPEVRESMVRNHPGVKSHESLAAALDDIDAVIIATPPISHCEVALEAMEAKKHVFVEKPMAMNSAECRQMMKAASDNDVTLAVGHTFVHNAAVWKLTELVQSGELGDLYYMDAARLNLGLYRADVNVLWDLAAHDISITHTVIGRAPDTVSAWALRHTEKYAEDVASMRLVYETENIDSMIRVSWLDPLKVRRTNVVGSQKMAIYNDLSADERVKILDRGREQDRAPNSDPYGIAYRYGDIHSPYIHFREPLRVQAEDFFDACLGITDRPAADGYDGLAVVGVLEAADLSISENGAMVPLELGVEPKR